MVSQMGIPVNVPLKLPVRVRALSPGQATTERWTSLNGSWRTGSADQHPQSTPHLPRTILQSGPGKAYLQRRRHAGDQSLGSNSSSSSSSSSSGCCRPQAPIATLKRQQQPGRGRMLGMSQRITACHTEAQEGAVGWRVQVRRRIWMLKRPLSTSWMVSPANSDSVASWCVLHSVLSETVTDV